MPYRTDLVYRYDGTLDGLMCCVYESYANKEMPAAILGPEDEQVSLLETRNVETDPFRAARVLKSIPGRISEDALYLVERAMLYLPARARKTHPGLPTPGLPEGSGGDGHAARRRGSRLS